MNIEPDDPFGYVCILRNPCMPGVLKISVSRACPDALIAELSKANTTPCSFLLEWQAWTTSPQKVESRVFQDLRQCRVSQDKDFFRVTLDEAVMFG
jgi:hypothetical protein